MRTRAPGSSFVSLLILITAGAFVIRLVHALAVAPALSGFADDIFYHGVAKELADGNGYVGTLDVFTFGRKLPTADHPPLYPLLLSALRLVGADSVDAQRLVGVLAGTATVGAVGLLGRRAGGVRAGLIAAGLCAIYPSFVAADGSLMSETLFGALVAFSLVQSFRLLSGPSWWGMAILGALVGVAALARPEGLLLLPLLAIPLLRRTEGARLRYAGILLAGCALVVTPWVARNWHEFGRPLFSTNEGITLAGANCDATYYGDHLGGFTTTCVEALGVPPDENKAQRAERLREEGLRYMADHAGRAIVVAGARFGRLWGVYRPSAQQGLPGRNADLQRVGIVVYYIVLVAGIAGAVLLHQRRRYRVLWILLAPVLVASLTAVATYGLVRLRHIAEISLLVLAGVALARLRPARALREN